MSILENSMVVLASLMWGISYIMTWNLRMQCRIEGVGVGEKINGYQLFLSWIALEGIFSHVYAWEKMISKCLLAALFACKRVSILMVNFWHQAEHLKEMVIWSAATNIMGMMRWRSILILLFVRLALAKNLARGLELSSFFWGIISINFFVQRKFFFLVIHST
jgi:hypothetical protein